MEPLMPLLSESFRSFEKDEAGVYPGFSSSELSIPTDRILGVWRANGGLGVNRP